MPTKPKNIKCIRCGRTRCNCTLFKKKIEGPLIKEISLLSLVMSRRKVEIDEELLNNIRDIGLIYPIVVMPQGSKYRVLDGLKRVAAYRTLNRTTIHALVKDGQS
jgi:hypothetical protein